MRINREKESYSIWIYYDANATLDKIMSKRIEMKDVWDKVEVVEDYIRDLAKKDAGGTLEGGGSGPDGRDVSVQIESRKMAIQFVRTVKKNLASAINKVEIFSPTNRRFVSDVETPDDFIYFMLGKPVDWYSWFTGKLASTGRG